ncbi:MAG: cytochrome c oxidase assembly protein [Actinobacteria bacterium]|nr:cytochrome c oxidase assembly protein [Actinomycetota bacterium]
MPAALDWLLAPPLLLAAVAAALHARGARRQLRVTSAARRRALRWRVAAFYAALATIVVALGAPIDDLVDTLFWVHMLQHVLLMMVAAPLLVLAAPWLPLWRGLPLGARRALGSWYVRSPGWRRVRRAARWLAAPLVAWILFDLDLLAWHVPALYEVTLHHQAVHELEHASFLLLGVIFWIQVLDSPPLRARLGPSAGVLYVLTAATAAWALAVVLALARSPLYPTYRELASRPGGLSALADQQLAAGIMWGPGSVPYAIFVFVALHRWLTTEDETHEPGGAQLAATSNVTRAGTSEAMSSAEASSAR